MFLLNSLIFLYVLVSFHLLDAILHRQDCVVEGFPVIQFRV
jgi:hypothetical protein